MAAALEKGVVSWSPGVGAQPVELPLVMGELARTARANNETITMLIPGFGETEESAREGVTVWEERFGKPAAASWISYALLPPTKSNLLKIAIDVPLALASHIGEGRPVNVITHSLGDLAVMAAAEAPELFEAIGADSPHALACGYWGKIPVLGSVGVLRPAAAAKRLLVDTGWQLRAHRSDQRLRRVFGEARSELTRLGLRAWSASAFAFSDPIIQRTANAFVSLAESGHPVLVVTGEADSVAPTGEVRQTLQSAANAAGLPAEYFADRHIEIPGMPHIPWSMRAEAKLSHFNGWLQRQAQ